MPRLEHELAIAISHNRGASILALRGTLNDLTAPRLERTFGHVCATITAPTTIALCCQDLRQVSSIGLRCIERLAQASEDLQVDFIIINAHGHIRSALQLIDDCSPTRRN